MHFGSALSLPVIVKEVVFASVLTVHYITLLSAFLSDSKSIQCLRYLTKLSPYFTIQLTHVYLHRGAASSILRLSAFTFLHVVAVWRLCQSKIFSNRPKDLKCHSSILLHAPEGWNEAAWTLNGNTLLEGLNTVDNRRCMTPTRVGSYAIKEKFPPQHLPEVLTVRI